MLWIPQSYAVIPLSLASFTTFYRLNSTPFFEINNFLIHYYSCNLLLAAQIIFLGEN